MPAVGPPPPAAAPARPPASDPSPPPSLLQITREQQVGLVEADELAPILICIDRRKHDELDAGIFEAHEVRCNAGAAMLAAGSACARAGADWQGTA